jgi:hypothetical protein
MEDQQMRLTQLLGLIFIILLAYVNFYFYRKKEHSRLTFILLSAIYLPTGVFIFFFDSIKEFTRIKGDALFDLMVMVVMAVVLLLVLIITYLYNKIKSNDKKINEIVQEMAMMDYRR